MNVDKQFSDGHDESKAAEEYLQWHGEYLHWRQTNLPPADTVARLRSEAREATEARKAPTQAWIQQTFGLLTPDHVFTFWAFWQGSSAVERRAAQRFVVPLGLFSFFEEKGRKRIPREGLDHRLAWRYYLDPPGFLTLLGGNSDGHHYGLWYDNPNVLPTFVAGYYSRDADAILIGGRTLLEVLKSHVELAARDWYPPANLEEAKDDLFPTWLVRDAIQEYETTDLRERGDTTRDAFIRDALQARLDTCNGIGVLVPSPYSQSIPYPTDVRCKPIRSDAPEITQWITEAEQVCAQGQPAFALALAHDLHWLSAGLPEREDAAWRLLICAYEVLGYEPLATIATLHHQHRHLESVDIY